MNPEDALEHVRQGWKHLQLQRPLAAWASWQRALRADPDDLAAVEALARLADAADLPSAARKVYRFRQPVGEARRLAWDAALQGRDLQDLGVAADTFRDLASADPSDPDARYNLALCLAWSGRNAEAIAALDEFVRLVAPDPARFEVAVDAWALAEILRQGAGAEDLADDVSQGLVIPWGPEHGDPTRLDAPGRIRPIPTPADPSSGKPPGDVRVFEWLDRPAPEPVSGLSARSLPRLVATIIQTPDSLRFSTPRPGGGFDVEDRVARALGDHPGPIRRETTLLPIRLMDADTWTFRLPAGLEEEDRLRLMREAVESYFEEDWARNRRRKGLAGPAGSTPDPTPAEAARLVAAGDPAAKARLSAVVNLREQLGERPGTAPLYAGYPFDRLRLRLGLEPNDTASVDPTDVTSMGLAGLSGLDPDTLDPPSLLDAFRGASSLLDPDLAARFASALIAREPALLAGSEDDLIPLLDRALDPDQKDPARVLDALARAAGLAGGRDRDLIELWAARYAASSASVEEALPLFQDLIARRADDPRLPLAAAETLAQSGEAEAGAPLAREALRRARALGDDAAAWEAEALIRDIEESDP